MEAASAISSSCSLYIDLEQKQEALVYSGGHTLKGVVRLELARDVEMLDRVKKTQQCTISKYMTTGIELRVYGGAFVKWSEKKDELEKTQIEHSAEEIYFNDHFVLWGQGKACPMTPETLEAGRHLLPFNVYLTPGIPSSYEGPCGWVRYHVEALLRTPREDQSVRLKKYFAVIRDLDLDTVKVDKSDLTLDREFLLHSTCCKAGRVNASIRLTKSLYVPGERIHADMDISNLSPRKIKTTGLALRQVVRYGSDSEKSHKVSLELRRITGDLVKPGKRQCWTSRAIEVPVVTPSRLEGCKFIDIHYEVVLLIDMSPAVLALCVPITIGTLQCSDVPHASYVYKAQFLPPNQRIRWDLTPEGTQPQSVAENQGDFSPCYKLYNFQTPKAKVIELNQSPHARRRRYLVLGDNTIQESTV